MSSIPYPQFINLINNRNIENKEMKKTKETLFSETSIPEMKTSSIISNNSNMNDEGITIDETNDTNSILSDITMNINDNSEKFIKNNSFNKKYNNKILNDLNIKNNQSINIEDDSLKNESTLFYQSPLINSESEINFSTLFNYSNINTTNILNNNDDITNKIITDYIQKESSFDYNTIDNLSIIDNNTSLLSDDNKNYDIFHNLNLLKN